MAARASTLLRLALNISIVIAFIAILYFGSMTQSLEPNTFVKIPKNSEQGTGLAYLNEVRVGVGLAPFSYNSILENSAQNHLKYLANLGIVTHYQSKKTEYSSGYDPSQRALNAGFSTNFVVENISSKHLGLDESIDGLLSAIYHRFNFLSFYYDEIGYFQDGEYYVFEMSNSRISRLCNTGDSLSRWFITEICKEPKRTISKRNFDLATKPDKPEMIIFPNENAATLATFGSEDPDPLLDCEITSAPVSVEFNPNDEISLKSFKIFKDNMELENTFLLQKNNDVNEKFNERQFALFSLLPFDFGTKYKAKISYEKNGQILQKEWEFSTKEPKYPYFVLKNGSVIELESAKTYELFFAPNNCNESIKEYRYNKPFGATLDIKDSGINQLQIKASGADGDIIDFESKTHKVKFIIKNSQKNFDFKLIFVGILAIILFIFMTRKVRAK